VIVDDELVALVISNHHLRMMVAWLDILYPNGKRLKAAAN
jgi:hypothetical protein